MKARAAILALVAALTLSPGARAGGGGFGADDDDNADAGPPYLGLVQSEDGKNLADAKITVTVGSANSSLVLRSDSVGHFFVRGFDKSVDPKDVTIACAKDGYADASASAAPAAGNAPIQVICVLKKR